MIDSSSWATILERGFGASPVHTRPTGERALNWSVFCAGPLRAAYARFPIGLDQSSWAMEDDISEHIACQELRDIDVVRISFAEGLFPSVLDRFSYANTPETEIYTLSTWDESCMAPSTRKKVLRAQQLGLRVVEATRRDAPAIFSMYRESLMRQGGKPRYNIQYFAALCDAALTEERLSIGIVQDQLKTPLGFIVVAHEKQASYYLHGGFAAHGASLRPGYFAMRWAISRACAFGSSRLNLLSSPPSQQALIRFKESFGGVTSTRRHAQIPISVLGSVANFGQRMFRDGKAVVLSWKRA